MATNGRIVLRSGMLIVLVLMVVLVFVVPALPFKTEHLQLAVDIMITLILAIGVLAVADHRRIALLLAILSVIAIAVRWSAGVDPAGELSAPREFSALIALLVLAIAVGISVFGKGKTAVDRIIGAVVLYLLLGLEWAVGYAIVEGVHPGAFTGNTEGVHAMQHWIYYSFITLTTVGFGDITPVARMAQSITIVEALVGQLYPAVILARLVSLPQESP